jgi:hypothetical protein
MDNKGFLFAELGCVLLLLFFAVCIYGLVGWGNDKHDGHHGVVTENTYAVDE